MEFEGARYYLKPMNCPFHILIYRSRGRSYRELPLRFFEFGTVYRYEKSGVIHGLTRVRGLTTDDAHIFCSKEQMGSELKNLLAFVLDLLSDYGLSESYAGAFPPWLDPVQVVGIPITDEHVSYLYGVAEKLRAHGIRVEVDTSDDRMQKKIRTATKQKVPYMLIAGAVAVAEEGV